MIDIHSHILPEIDDGAKDLETSLEMLKIAESEGTKRIFATPHFYRGYFDKSFNEVKELTNTLNKVARDKKIKIEILPGQEVFLERETPIHFKEGLIGTLNNTKYILIELPMDKLPGYALDSMYELGIQGLIPILAHPERYKYIIDKPSRINRFIDEGCLFQINSGSLTGLFGKEVKKTAETLIKHGTASFIASDAHTTNKRCPGLQKSSEIVNKIDVNVAKILEDNVEKISKNCDISHKIEKIKEKRSFFNIIFKK